MLIFSPLKLCRLLLKTSQFFSIKNYQKTFAPSQVTRHHSVFKVDEYVHFDNDPSAVERFIQKQNELFEAESAKWKDRTEEYYQISSSRRDNRNSTIAEAYDNYEYYTKVAWKNGREYSIIYRRNLEGGNEELVLDIMHYPQINRYYKTVELLRTSFSPSHRYIGFGVDIRNDQRVSFFIADILSPKKELKRLKVGEQQQKKLQDANDIIFASESEVFYTKSQNFRPSKVFYHNFETGQVSQILAENDSQYYLNIRATKDKKYLIISGESKLKTKIWILQNGSAKSGKKAPVKIWQDSSKVYINHVQNYLIVWMKGINNKISLIFDSQFQNRLNSKMPAKEGLNLKNFKQTLIHTCLEQQNIQDIDIVKDNILLYINHINRPKLKVINYQVQSANEIITKVYDAPLPYENGVIMPGTNQNYHTNEIIFNVSTPFVYEQTYGYSLTNKKFRVLQEYSHTGPSISRNKYEIKNIDVPSTTNDHIPLTIIGPKNKKIGKMLIHVYGFYGIPSKITYDNVTIAALEKGWTIAYAHVRGGGEKGVKWHQQGKGQKRERTWKDLQQCIGYLIRQQYTHPSLLFISTSSAGAIAAWNAANHKPHLYKGLILKYPFLDVLNSLMDPSQPLSNSDYEQFGNPVESKQAYKQIEAISPYENIMVKEYPAIHIVAGENDYRTPLGQIAKFTSRFRDRALQNGRFSELGIKNLTVDISKTASHLGQASVKDQNYKGCDVFGYMDYVINEASHDCKLFSE